MAPTMPPYWTGKVYLGMLKHQEEEKKGKPAEAYTDGDLTELANYVFDHITLKNGSTRMLSRSSKHFQPVCQSSGSYELEILSLGFRTEANTQSAQQNKRRLIQDDWLDVDGKVRQWINKDLSDEEILSKLQAEPRFRNTTVKVEDIHHKIILIKISDEYAFVSCQ